MLEATAWVTSALFSTLFVLRVRNMSTELKLLLKASVFNQCPSVQFSFSFGAAYIKWHGSGTDIVLKGTAQAFSLFQYTIGHDFTPRTNDFHQTLITDVTAQASRRAHSERRNLCSSRVCVFVCFISTGRWTEFLQYAVCRRISAVLLFARSPFALGLFQSLFSHSPLMFLTPKVWWGLMEHRAMWQLDKHADFITHMGLWSHPCPMFLTAVP